VPGLRPPGGKLRAPDNLLCLEVNRNGRSRSTYQPSSHPCRRAWSFLPRLRVKVSRHLEDPFAFQDIEDVLPGLHPGFVFSFGKVLDIRTLGGWGMKGAPGFLQFRAEPKKEILMDTHCP
jgi:hypothetical protein